MNLFKASCICLSLLLFSCISSCNTESDKSSNSDGNRKAAERKLAKETQAQKDAEETAELQRISAEQAKEIETKELELKKLELKLAEDALIQEKKIEEEERLRQKAIITELRKEQKTARDKFIGTTYETLTVDGRIYKNLKVTRATDKYVSFLHSSGVSTINYMKLSLKSERHASMTLEPLLKRRL